MLLYYFKLKIKFLIRLMREVGILRTTILFSIICFIITVLCKIEHKWFIPCLYLLIFNRYNKTRKDKLFITEKIPSACSFFQKEYLILSLPFILIELPKGNWLGIIFILASALLLPYFKSYHFHINPIKLKILYQGNMEYIRMFRQYHFAYILLLIVSFLGCYHGNIRIIKVCMMIWGILQSNAYTHPINREYITIYKNYNTLQQIILRANIWNILILSAPFITILITYSSLTSEWIFILSYIVSCIFLMQYAGISHFIHQSQFSLLIFLIIYLPVYTLSYFIPLANIVSIVYLIIVSFVLYNKSKMIWN